MKVYLLHHPAWYTAQISVLPTPWDNQVYAMNGEVIGNIAATIQFPEEPFQLTSMVRACTIEQIDEFFNMHPNAELLDVTLPMHQGAKKLKTWPVMYMQSKYVAGLLNPQGISPQKLWELIIPQLWADEKLEECKVLVNWLQAATAIANAQVNEVNPLASSKH